MNNVIEIPELALTSCLMDELRTVINGKKYDQMRVSELCGSLELLKLEYALKWNDSK
jgi:hypothetical protein